VNEKPVPQTSPVPQGTGAGPAAEPLSRQKELIIRIGKLGRIGPLFGYKEESVKLGHTVIVETERGLEYGQIQSVYKDALKNIPREVRLKKVIRYANDADLAQIANLAKKEEEIFLSTVSKVKEHELEIKIIETETTLDHKKCTIYFRPFEEKKIKGNFKDFSKDLAAALNCRLDLKQLGLREEAKLRDGYGPCGQRQCCSRFLPRTPRVSVKMVKAAGVPMSPSRTAGMCGRLMCCFSYEYDEESHV
jgi:cell fate regulator YaaT (PSP1 superfamily)